MPARLALVAPLMTLITSTFLHGGWPHLVGDTIYRSVFDSRDGIALQPFEVFQK
jgi:membrane associated rhomboid family serine protease